MPQHATINLSEVQETESLNRDSFGIPLLPEDFVSEHGGFLNATIHLFTDITQNREKFIKVSISNASKSNVLAPFYYTKPDPGTDDPRNPKNITFVDEKSLNKLRSGYVLLALIPQQSWPYRQIWGSRNHMHAPVTSSSPGLVCAVYDDEEGSWSTRSFFELENIEFANGGGNLDELISL